MIEIVDFLTKKEFKSKFDFSYSENPDEFIQRMKQMEFIQQWLEEKGARIPKLLGEGLEFSKEFVDDEDKIKRLILKSINIGRQSSRKKTLLVRTKFQKNRILEMINNNARELEMLEKYPAYNKIILISV